MLKDLDKDMSSSCCLNECVREVTSPEILRCSKYSVQKLDNCLPLDGFSMSFLYCFTLEMSWACPGLLNTLILLLVQRHFIWGKRDEWKFPHDQNNGIEL